MSCETVIVRAKTEWCFCLTAIAHAAKASWGYPVSWLNAWQTVLTITPRHLRSHTAFVAMCDGRLAGFYSVDLGEGLADLEHLWVLPKFMGRGVGTALLRHAIVVVAEAGLPVIRVESDPNAEPFYCRFGARRVGCAESLVDGVARTLPVLQLATASGSSI